MPQPQSPRLKSGAPAEWVDATRPERRRARRWGVRAQVVTAVVVGGLALLGLWLLPEGNTALWEVGSCVSAQNSRLAGDVGDSMVAVRCDEPNEGRIIGIAEGRRRCPERTEYFVLARGGSEVFCIARGLTTPRPGPR